MTGPGHGSQPRIADATSPEQEEAHARLLPQLRMMLRALLAAR